MSVVSFQDKFAKLADGYELTEWLAYRPEVQPRWVVTATGGTFVEAADGSWTRDYTANIAQDKVLVEMFTRSRSTGERTRIATFYKVDAPASAVPRRLVITLTLVNARIGRMYTASHTGKYLYVDWEFQI